VLQIKKPKEQPYSVLQIKKTQRATFLNAPNKTTVGVSHHTKLWKMIRQLFNRQTNQQYSE